jgi:hypothetical protein
MKKKSGLPGNRSIDELQQDATELIKTFMRTELGKDYYDGKVMAIVITANSITDKVNIDSCNLGTGLTNTKAQAMILSALGQLKRVQMANALVSVMHQHFAKILDNFRHEIEAFKKERKGGKK